MNKQRIFATILSTAVLSAMIGCGQKNEIDQSVPDTIIEIAKTTSATSITSNTPYQTASSTASSNVSNTSSISASSSVSTTTAVTTIHYAGNPNLTVRKTAEVIPETQPATQVLATTVTTVPVTEVSVTEAPTEAPSEQTVTTIGSLVAPNGMFTAEDMRFTFDGISIQPGEDSMAFRTAMQEKGILSTEWVDGFPFISYDELGIKLELIGDGLGTKAITISGATVATEKGIHVGSTPDEVRAAYGSVYEPVNGGAIYRYLFDSNGDGENDYQLDITFDGNSLVSEITYCCITIG